MFNCMGDSFRVSHGGLNISDDRHHKMELVSDYVKDDGIFKKTSVLNLYLFYF